MYVYMVYICNKCHFGKVPPAVYDIESRLLQYIYHTNVKVKVTLKETTKAPEGEQWYCFTPSLTSALDEGGWSTPHTGHRPSRF